jgi:hypothetical protein
MTSRPQSAAGARLGDPSRALPPSFTVLQKAYLISGTVMPLLSCVAYGAVPAGTVEYFGGASSPAATYWCSRTLAADALYAHSCWWVLRSHTKGLDGRGLLRQLVRSCFLYGMLHFGSFWYDHLYVRRHPDPSLYPVALLMGLAATAAWGCRAPSLADGPALLPNGAHSREEAVVVAVSGWQRAYFGAAAAVATVSTLLLAACPSLVVKIFPGSEVGATVAQQSSTEFWCRVQAGGDVIVLFLNAWALSTTTFAVATTPTTTTTATRSAGDGEGRAVRKMALHANLLYVSAGGDVWVVA